MRRIDAPKAWTSTTTDGKRLVPHTGTEEGYNGFVRVHVIRERDYRLMLAVVRAAEAVLLKVEGGGVHIPLQDALDAFNAKPGKP